MSSAWKYMLSAIYYFAVSAACLNLGSSIASLYLGFSLPKISSEIDIGSNSRVYLIL
jgi:hypothetical protein